MIRGLQAGFRARRPDGTIDGESVVGRQRFKGYGVEAIRLDCQRLGAERTRVLAQEISDTGLTPLVTVWDSEDMAALPPGTHVEFRGEPDLFSEPGPPPRGPRIEPAEYRRQLLADIVPMAESRDLLVWAGVVSGLHQRGIDYLRALEVKGWPWRVNVSVHWYAHGVDQNPARPHPGFTSRDDEVRALKSVIAGRRWMVSETGFHTAQQRRVSWLSWSWPGNTVRLSEAQQAAYATTEWAFWARHGAVAAVWFQSSDGPNPREKEHGYGIERIDGTPKPVAATFRRTS